MKDGRVPMIGWIIRKGKYHVEKPARRGSLPAWQQKQAQYGYPPRGEQEPAKEWSLTQLLDQMRDRIAEWL